MSGSSPSDLAVTFRSLARRLREAEGHAPAEVIAPHRHRLEHHLGEAATLLGSSAEASAIADAIDRVPATEWTDDVLDAVRRVALDVGAAMRAIAAAAGDAER